jgi:hypothetical protein
VKASSGSLSKSKAEPDVTRDRLTTEAMDPFLELGIWRVKDKNGGPESSDGRRLSDVVSGSPAYPIR